MKSVSPELDRHVLQHDIDVSAISQLAAVYHRSLARALCRVADQPDVDLGQVRHLSPQLVQAVYRGRPTPNLASWLRDSSAAATPITMYDAVRPEPWVVEGLQDVMRSLGWGEEQVAHVVAPSVEVARSFHLAAEALKTAWPEAWAEVNVLVDQVVYLDGPVRSATHQSTFGIIWAQNQEASDPELMFEMLLHEGGHHSLALREQFATFLTNPDQLATHAFRTDPRPLHGVLHAAFVVGRMWQGLVRYRDAYGTSGPLEGTALTEREEFTRKGFTAAVETLDEHADWTPEGRELFASLQQGTP